MADASFVSVDQLSNNRAIADWCQDLAWRIAVHYPLSTGNFVANVDKDSESHVPSADVSNLSISPMFNMGARGNSVQHKEKFENVPEDLQPIEACDDAGFKRNVSLGHFFVAIHDIQMAGFGCTNSCRENDHRSEPKGAIRGNTKIAPRMRFALTNACFALFLAMGNERQPKETSTPKSLACLVEETPKPFSCQPEHTVRAMPRVVATNPRRQINFELPKRVEQLDGWLAESVHNLS